MRVNPEIAFQQKRAEREMNRFYQKEYNKMTGLMEQPKITKKLIEEYLHFCIGATIELKCTEITEAPNSVWKHACVPTGIVEVAPVTVSLYGTLIRYIACPSCMSITYEVERLDMDGVL